MKIQNFQDLFVVLLSEAYLLEKHVVNLLPVLTNRVYDRELKSLLEEHLKETETQLERIETIFRVMQEKPRFLEWSSAMKNLFSHIEQFLEENPSSVVLDAALIALVQKIEHMELASFGTLTAFADALDQHEVKGYLKEAVKESSKADAALSKLATGKFFTTGINVEAARK